MTDRPQARDLLVSPFYEGDSWGSLDLVMRSRLSLPEARSDLEVAGSSLGGVSPGPLPVADFDVAAGHDALRQALLLRLLTPLGSLATLGHAGYGSRLHELIGGLNVPSNRQLARSYVLRAIRSEPRVEDVLAVEVAEPDMQSMDRIQIHVVVTVKDLDDPIALGIEVAL